MLPSLDRYDDDVLAHRAPTPGIAAVLSVLLPGLGQVYCGRLVPGAVWFLCDLLLLLGGDPAGLPAPRHLRLVRLQG